jgi:hypothetical protein
MASDDYRDQVLSAHSDWAGAPHGFGLYEPDDAELEAATEQAQRAAMKRWFLARYCDPARETPFESAAGGYIWIHGGPYDPGEEMTPRFCHVVDYDVIDQLAIDLRREGGRQWAPIWHEDAYDTRYEIDLPTPDAPLVGLKDRLAQALSLLALQGDKDAMRLVRNLAFGSAISAFEAFLWETVVYWVENDKSVLRSIVTKLPDMKDVPIKLGDIFGHHDGLQERVKGYLQNLVWHRWDKVAQLFAYGFGFKTPSFKPFEDALVRRHHIVHRSGFDQQGVAVVISHADVAELADLVESFAQEVHALIVYHVVLKIPSENY